MMIITTAAIIININLNMCLTTAVRGNHLSNTTDGIGTPDLEPRHLVNIGISDRI